MSAQAANRFQNFETYLDWPEDWWQKRHESILERHLQNPKWDLVLLGDSLTHHWEDRSGGLWQELNSKYKASNLGFSGDRTEHLLWRLQNGELDHIHTKTFCILIGTNNTGHRKDSPEEIVFGIQAIIQQLQLHCPQANILVYGLLPRGEDPNSFERKNNELVNSKLLKTLELQKVRFVNLEKKFLTEEGSLRMELMPDGLHLNELGYTQWHQSLMGEIENFMDD